MYKYLFIGGLGLIILSLFYPLNRKYEYTTQKDLYDNEVKLLNYDISTLNQTTQDLNNNVGEIKKELQSKSISEKDKKALKDSFFRQLDAIKSSRKSIDKKNLDIEFHEVKINTLQSHINDFTKYQTAFLVFGVIATLGGAIGWFIIMKHYGKKT